MKAWFWKRIWGRNILSSDKSQNFRYVLDKSMSSIFVLKHVKISYMCTRKIDQSSKVRSWMIKSSWNKSKCTKISINEFNSNWCFYLYRYFECVCALFLISVKTTLLIKECREIFKNLHPMTMLLRRKQIACTVRASNNNISFSIFMPV